MGRTAGGAKRLLMVLFRLPNFTTENTKNPRRITKVFGGSGLVVPLAASGDFWRFARSAMLLFSVRLRAVP